MVPLVSVIMPVYNAELYLETAVKSILVQSFKDFEFLIFDDGSTDRSWNILQSFADDRIKLFHSNINKGYVHHLNDGIALSVGKYVARMDADDISHPERLERQVAFMEANSKVVLCGTRYQNIGSGLLGSLPCSDGTIRLCLLNNNVFAHPTVMMRRHTLIEHQLRYPVISVIEDYGLWSVLSQFGQMANLPDYLLSYRDGVGVSSTPLSDVLVQENRKLQGHYALRFFKQSTLSEDEILRLSVFLVKKQVDKLEDLRCFAAIVKKLKQQFSHEYVSKEAMEAFVDKHFFYVSTCSTYLGPRVVWLYICNAGFRKASVGLLLKLALKSLVFYHKK
jgi:glycosyltransferase involved in cell wall biosynthesis